VTLNNSQANSPIITPTGLTDQNAHADNQVIAWALLFVEEK
jgi:hypothetical protein